MTYRRLLDFCRAIVEEPDRVDPRSDLIYVEFRYVSAGRPESVVIFSLEERPRAVGKWDLRIEKSCTPATKASLPTLEADARAAGFVKKVQILEAVFF